MKHVTQQNNFIYFTAALLLLLLASAFVDSVPESKGMMLVELFILLTHVVAYMSLNFGRYWRYFVLIMFVIIATANIFQPIFGLVSRPGCRLDLHPYLLRGSRSHNCS